MGLCLLRDLAILISKSFFFFGKLCLPSLDLQSSGYISVFLTFMCIQYIYSFTVNCDRLLNSIEVLLGYGIGVATNFTILSQIVMYQKPQAAKEKKVK